MYALSERLSQASSSSVLIMLIEDRDFSFNLNPGKCSYVPPEVEGHKGWNDDFFKKIGLPEFVGFDL